MPTLYKIRGFTPTDSAITLYAHKLWHRRHFLNREVPYWLQSSITGSPFCGLLLILQNNSILTDKKIFRSRMGAFRCIVTPLTRNTQTVIGHTNLCNKYGGPWTLAILALHDNLTFDLTHLIRMHIEGNI